MSAVTGNYASYLSYRHKHAGAGAAQQVWYYDINKVLSVRILGAEQSAE